MGKEKMIDNAKSLGNWIGEQVFVYDEAVRTAYLVLKRRVEG